MKRVLVTGATGFVGRHALRPLLERGFEVHAVARTRPAGSGADPVTWHEIDLMDPAATKARVGGLGVTHLLHFAWYAKHGSFWEAPENADWVASSLRLLRAFHASGGRRVVVAGTCAEYDWSGDCCGEQTPLAPATLYGVTKNALRAVVGEYGRATGLSSAWGRIFFTFGPGEHPTRVVAAVARALVQGEAIPCTAGTQVRDFLYVEDVAAAFAALVDAEPTGAFDVGSGQGVALRALLERLERLAGREHLVRFGELPQRPEPPRIVADSTRLSDELGWRPGITLDEGLKRTLAWWRDAAPATVG